MINITFGSDLREQKPAINFTTLTLGFRNQVWGCVLEPFHPQYAPFPNGRMTKENVILLRDFLTDVLKEHELCQSQATTETQKPSEMLKTDE